MAGNYTIWLSSQTGQHMRVLEDWLKLDYARSTNDVGQLVLTVPPKFDMSLAPVDSRIEIWRSPTGGVPILETGTTWLVRGPLDTVIPERGDRTKVIRAASAADLLRRRIVAYAAGSPQAKKSMAADEMVKQIMWENFNALSGDPARSLASYLTIQPGAAVASATVAAGAVTAITVLSSGTGYTSVPTVAFAQGAPGGAGTGATATATLSGDGVASVAVGAGGTGYTSAPTVVFTGGRTAAAPSLAKEFAYANVLSCLKDIAAASAQAGTRLYFDIVAPTPSTLEFRTYVGQRGTDHGTASSQPVVFSTAFGNLTGITLSKDYSAEETYIYVGGQGTGSARVTNSAEDTARSGRSVFGRREAFVSDTATTDTTAAALLPTANAELQRGRPKKRLSATILSTPSALYGKHFTWGDKIVANVAGEIFDARIEAIHVSVTDRKEVIDIKIAADDDL